MKLYFAPGSCSMSPHIALIEAGLEFEAIRVDLKTKKLEDGSDYLRISPKGQVPALAIDGGDLFTEGAVLVQYIADLRPEANLAPPQGSLERYRLMEWLNYVATEIHKGFGPLWNPATPDAYKAITAERLNKQFAYLNSHFTNNKYLMGDNFTVADGYLFTCVNWTNMLKMDVSAYPNLIRFMTRVAERPAVQQAMQNEGLIAKAA
jgi:glutathione S-transferase